MKNKSLFIFMLCAVFVSSIAAGYFLPKILAGTQNGQNVAAISPSPDPRMSQQPFVPPSVPKKQMDDFARHFPKLEAATQSLYLPDDEIVTTQGEKVRLSSFAGTPVLVNLWATWCLPCVVELPSLQKFAKLYEGKIKVVAISVDDGKTPEDIAAFLEMRGISPDVAGYLDFDGVFLKKLGLRGVPTSFLIGSQGQILYRFEGNAEWTLPDSTEFFDVFLLQNQ